MREWEVGRSSGAEENRTAAELDDGFAGGVVGLAALAVDEVLLEDVELLIGVRLLRRGGGLGGTIRL